MSAEREAKPGPSARYEPAFSARQLVELQNTLTQHQPLLVAIFGAEGLAQLSYCIGQQTADQILNARPLHVRNLTGFRVKLVVRLDNKEQIELQMDDPKKQGGALVLPMAPVRQIELLEVEPFEGAIWPE